MNHFPFHFVAGRISRQSHRRLRHQRHMLIHFPFRFGMAVKAIAAKRRKPSARVGPSN
jgi:hypothetical protein